MWIFIAIIEFVTSVTQNVYFTGVCKNNNNNEQRVVPSWESITAIVIIIFLSGFPHVIYVYSYWLCYCSEVFYESLKFFELSFCQFLSATCVHLTAVPINSCIVQKFSLLTDSECCRQQSLYLLIGSTRVCPIHGGQKIDSVMFSVIWLSFLCILQ